MICFLNRRIGSLTSGGRETGLHFRVQFHSQWSTGWPDVTT